MIKIRSLITAVVLLLLVFFVYGQDGKFISKTINYTQVNKISSGNTTNIKFYRPVNGFYDFDNHMPNFKVTIPKKFDLSSFDFSEEKLNEQEQIFYKGQIFNSNYDYKVGIQENDDKNIYKSVIFTCLRKKENIIYRLKTVKLILQETENNTFKLNRSNLFVQNSILSNGSSWFKFRNFEKGIYKLDYNFLLSNGIISGDISSNSVHIYANNNGLLGATNDDQRVDDLIHQTIFVVDGGDGVFSDGDYILFYLNSSHREQWNGENFTHTNHIYSDSGYFFLNVNSQINTNKIDTIDNLNENFDHSINSFKQFKYLEEDRINLLKSGSNWLGDIFDINNDKSYSFLFNNILDSSHVKVKLVSKSNYSTAYFNLSLFGESKQIPINSSGSSYYSPVGRSVTQEFDFLNNPNQQFKISLNYDNNGSPSSKGYLDYIEVNCNRELRVDNQQFKFLVPQQTGNTPWSKISLSNADEVDMIWEITNLNDVKQVSFIKNGTEIYFIANLNVAKQYVAISGSNFPSPQYFKPVDYQNLHGLQTPDMFIITPIEFKNSAEKLMSIHQDEGLDVAVVTDEEIYNEFSGGIPDATAIKQFLRMFYVRELGDPTKIPKYCLLFGDGSYDNKNILKHGNNFLPVFQSSESLSVTSTYASDDYYAILSDNASMLNTDMLNIAVGRLTVDDIQTAELLVDKIGSYLSRNDTINLNSNCANNNSSGVLGSWRNKVVLVSDDEDNNAYFNDVEIMSNKIEEQKQQMNIFKIHSDAYAQLSSPVGEKIPDANSAIDNAVKSGALVVNYIGHGGETGWAHEGILDVETIKSWDNILNMPVFMTATCEFGRFDDHDRVSAGEYVFNNTDGAGIGLFTTTRLVYANPNEDLNRYFYDTVFDLVNNIAQTLGDIYVGTKNKFALLNGDPNYRKFALLGDPAIKLAMAEKNVLIDSINKDTVNALSEVIIHGHVADHLQNKLTNFNGRVYITFFDKKSTYNTLGTNSGSTASTFQMWKNIIYKGKSSVNNGEFSFTFKVPKDISYNYGLSRISFYAENSLVDASGYNNSLVIGGIDTTVADDKIGPELDIFLNDESFVSGGITNKNPLLIVSVFDENGINTVGNGIGHDIELIIDNDYANTIILNDYYDADLDTYKSGKINYELNQFSEGEHILKVKVWDIYNNSSEKEIIFNVQDNKEVQLDHVLNYPNPFTNRTEFFFEHNQNCNYLDVSIQIYNVSGKTVKRINRRIYNKGFRSDGILWDGRDEFGDKLSQGVYLYNIKVVNEQGLSSDKTESMFLLK